MQYLVILLVLLAGTCLSYPDRPQIKTIHRFPNGTWIENLRTRKNGGILTTVNLASQGLYHIDPSFPDDHRSKLVSRFNQSATTGITEVFPDIFAVLNGDLDFDTFEPTPGTWAVYLVDMRRYDHAFGRGATVKKVADIPHAGVLNGATTLNAHGVVLASDSGFGYIWKINVRTGGAEIAIDDPALKPGSPIPAGVNGLKFRNGQVFFSNPFQAGGFLGRLQIDHEGKAIGPVDVFARNLFVDDFSLDGGSDLYVALSKNNTVAKVNVEGEVTDLGAGLVPGPTATFFSQSNPDILCVTSSSGQVLSVEI